MKVPQRHSMIFKTADSLREAIRSGEFGIDLPGVRRLSTDLRVSIPTILGAINVLREEGLVVSQAGKKTRIIPALASGVKSMESPHQVVILTFKLNWFSGSSYYQTVLDELRTQGIRLRLYEGVRYRSRSHGEELEKIVAQEKPDCWVLLGPTSEVQYFFAERQLPCIIDGITLPGLPLPDFEVDFSALYRHAVHQFQAVGHRHICLLTSAASAQNNPESIETFRSSVARKLSEPWESIRLHDGSNEQLERQLRLMFLTRATRPTALLLVTVKHVAYTMTWLMKHGVRIPEDVSIISREHEEIIESLYPRPAYYRQPATAAARFIRAILAVVNRRHIRSHKRVMTDFIPGGSVAARAVE